MKKKIITPDFFIGNLGSPEANKEILSFCPSDFNQEALVENFDDKPDHRDRKCLLSWLEVSESNEFIETGLKTIIQNVNDMIWKMELNNVWETSIQFAKYEGKGDHFCWHRDTYDDIDCDRKISVVYCLSKKSDYTGGEFEIKKEDGSVYKIKFDLGDFIVFPSTTLHRVKALRTGKRMTMVGWIN